MKKCAGMLLLLLLTAATARAQHLSSERAPSFGMELALSPELSTHFELASRLTPLAPLPPASFGDGLGPRTVSLDRFGFALLGCLGSSSTSERGVSVCAGPELTGLYARGRDAGHESASLLGDLNAALRFDVRVRFAPRWMLTASALLLLASLSSQVQTNALMQLWLGVRYEF